MLHRRNAMEKNVRLMANVSQRETDVLMRRDGAVLRVIPRSSYAESPTDQFDLEFLQVFPYARK